jgi:hypothetical protein
VAKLFDTNPLAINSNSYTNPERVKSIKEEAKPLDPNLFDTNPTPSPERAISTNKAVTPLDI